MVNTMANKKTINEMYAELLNLAEVKANPEFVEFIEGRIAVNNKKSESKKQTSTQKANEEIKNVLVEEILSGGQVMTVTQMTKALESKYPEITLNKVNALVRQLKLDGVVTRNEEKGVAYFSLA